jgi:uncharacterized protein YqhQ
VRQGVGRKGEKKEGGENYENALPFFSFYFLFYVDCYFLSLINFLFSFFISIFFPIFFSNFFRPKNILLHFFKDTKLTLINYLLKFYTLIIK